MGGTGESQEAGSAGAGQTGLSDQERLAKAQQEEIQLDLDFQPPCSLRGEGSPSRAGPTSRWGALLLAGDCIVRCSF